MNKKPDIRKLKGNQTFVSFPTNTRITLKRRVGNKFEETTITLEELVNLFPFALYEDKFFKPNTKKEK